ncbi:MAG: DUF2829 domain-containing protein [Candidatus Hydrogenedentes bacterium]|nr:DUF2829 domain-containing protein [Candidatus Hydrogenedentota bacterium]
MNFSEALERMKDGRSVTRKGWNAPNQWVKFSPGMRGGGIELESFFYLFNAQGKRVVWIPSTADLLAEDWDLTL